MKYIKLNELINNFFGKIPVLVVIFLVLFAMLYAATPFIAYDFVMKNTISPAKVANRIIEEDENLLLRVRSHMFNNKYRAAGGVSDYQATLNKGNMVDVEFKSDNKEDLFRDMNYFINQLRLAFSEIKKQNLSQELYIELYQSEVDKLKKISDKSNYLQNVTNIALDAGLAELLHSNRESMLSSQIINLSEKLITTKTDEDVKWLYDMSVDDVQKTNYIVQLIIGSFSMSMFFYFGFLLFRYGKKINK